MKNLTSVLLGFGLWLSVRAVLVAQPVTHHFGGIALTPDKSVILKLNGSASNLFNLTGTVSNQFLQMFDLYLVEASADLLNWTRLDLLLRTNNDPNPLMIQDTNAVSFQERFYRTFTNNLVTPFAKPTGPYPVGTVSRVLTDPSRTNRYNIKTNSSFMGTFWYPADRIGAAALPGPYTPRRAEGLSPGSNASLFWMPTLPALRGVRVSTRMVYQSHSWP
jgi:hypothetical protein